MALKCTEYIVRYRQPLNHNKRYSILYILQGTERCTGLKVSKVSLI